MTEILSLIGGALIGWVVASYFYKRSSQELKNEASELRRLTELVLRGMQNAGLVKLKRDEQGKIVGFIIDLKPSDIVVVRDVAKVKISEPEE